MEVENRLTLEYYQEVEIAMMLLQNMKLKIILEKFQKKVKMNLIILEQLE
jgi:hypothetical protein